MTVFIQWLAGIVGSLVLIAGLMWAGVKFLEFIVRQCKCYHALAEFIWHRDEIREWLKTNCSKFEAERTGGGK